MTDEIRDQDSQLTPSETSDVTTDAGEQSVSGGETQRRTIRIPDDEWERARVAAEQAGDSISAVVRRALSAFSMRVAGDLPSYGIEYRASSALSLGGKAQTITGLTGPVDQIRSVFKSPVWTIEERDVSPYRPVKAGSKTQAGSLVPGESLNDPISFHDVKLPDRDGDNLQLCIGVLDDHRNRRQIPYVIQPDGKSAHVAVVGASGSGRTTTIKTIIAATAQTYSPAEAQFYVIDATTPAFDIGESDLADIVAYPNVGNLVDANDNEMVDRVLAEIKRIVDLRGSEFTRRGVRDFVSYTRAKSTEPHPSDPYGHVFLVIDGIGELFSPQERATDTRRENRIAMLKSIAKMGPALGVHLIVTAEDHRIVPRASSTQMPLFLSDLPWLPILHYVADTVLIPVRIEHGVRTVYKTLPPNQPGRAVEPVHGMHARIVVPQLEPVTGPSKADSAGESEAINHSHGIRALGEYLASKTDMRAPTVARVSERNDWDAVWATYESERDAGTPRQLPLGTSVDELQLVTLAMEGPESASALMVVGDQGSGKTTVVRSLLRSIAEQYTSDQAQIYLVDPGYGLIEEANWLRLQGLLAGHATRPEQIEATSGAIAEVVSARRPDPDTITAAQMRAGTWYTGPVLFVVIEGAATVSEVNGFAATSPTAPLAAAMDMQRDLGMSMGLQVVATDRTHRYHHKSGATPLYKSLRAVNADMLLLSSEGTDYIPLTNSTRTLKNGERRRPGLGQFFSASTNGNDPVVQAAWIEPFTDPEQQDG